SVNLMQDSQITVLPNAASDDKACTFVGTDVYVPLEVLNYSPATTGAVHFVRFDNHLTSDHTISLAVVEIRDVSVNLMQDSQITVLPNAASDDKACTFVGTDAYVPLDVLNSSPATIGV
nr:3-phosphoinositide-dependent protein kinase 1 [Tanacetum cinerariifolium]